MGWNLFLDDEREPPRGGRDWTVARSCAEARQLIEKLGCPRYISFDHDLGAGETGVYPDGKTFANWLIQADLDSDFKFLPKNFDFYVHSQNPVGAENITLMIVAYLEFRERYESTSN